MNQAIRSTLGVLGFGLLGLVGPAAAEPRSLLDAVFTEDQAEQGEDLFQQHCRTCHDTSYFQPVLRAWQGESMAVLYDIMVGSMPQSNPGSLLDREYIDILAYILDENDYPAGEAPLEYRGGALDDITITAP